MRSNFQKSAVSFLPNGALGPAVGAGIEGAAMGAIGKMRSKK